MQRRTTITATILTTVLLFARPAHPAPRTVDTLADPARLRVEGANLISADQIRAALRNDSEFQLASTPSAPLDAFVKTILERLLPAYQHAGFPEPSAGVSIDEATNTVILRVTEGRRLTAGKVLVEAPGGGRITGLDTDALIHATLARKPPRFPMQTAPTGARRIDTWGPPADAPLPLWTPGQPARLDTLTQQRLGRDFGDQLARRGHFQPHIGILPRPEGDRASLVFEIVDPGPRATLGEIEFTGLNRNKPEDLIRHLGLKQDMPLDTDVLQELAAKLWNSARFWKHTITASPIPQSGGRIKLTIDLDEHPDASLLKDPLTLDEIAMLRIRDGLEKLAAGERDIVVAIRRPEVHARLVVRAGAGLAVRAQPPPNPPPASVPTLATDFGFVADASRVAFYDVTGQQILLARTGERKNNVQVNVTASIAPSLQAGAKERFNYLIGAGIKTGTSNPSALSLDVVLAPVCFLDCAHPFKAAGRVGAKANADGIISVDIGTFVFRFRRDTGELVDATSHDKATGVIVSITAEAGALEREAQALDAAVRQAQPPAPQPATAVVFAAVAHFMADGLGANATPPIPLAARTRAIAAAREFARQAGLWTADMAAARQQGDPHFEIPADLGKVARAAGPLGFIAQGLPFVDHAFPRGSWPWTLARESLLVVSGRGKHAKLEAGRIYRSDDVGPLGFLAIAWTYSHIDSVSARIFAKRGLERMTFDYFAKDCQTLLGPTQGKPSPITAAVSSLRHLGDDDLDAIAGLLPPKPAAALRILAAHQRQLPENSPALLPPTLQKQLWDAGLKEALHAALTHFSQVD